MDYDVFISYSSKDKLIADAVCHFIEERRMKCFIAPRDIVPPDWATSINNAIENSKAFVIIVSENSLKSNEVAKEIALATSRSSYIFPFKIDKSEIMGGMKYHLTVFHWIDAVNPPLENRINELVNRIENAVLYEKDGADGNFSSRNKSLQKLVGKIKAPREEFIGREKEILEIDSIFESGKNSVFIYGMGGIGKSEIAKAYAQRYADKYSTILFASYETDLMHLIADDKKIEIENFQQASAAGGQGETVEDYYERKLKVLKSLVKKDTLLIIDNFDVEGDDNFEDIYQLNCKIIWTTRTDFSAFGYTTIPVGPIEDIKQLEELYCTVDKNYASEDEKQAIRDIIDLLDRHTLAISLTAAQSKTMRATPSKMLEKLKTEGLKFSTRSKFAREMNSKMATAYQFIESLFDFSNLDEYSIEILRHLSCMPLDGVDIDLFMECTDLDDFGDIQRLIDLNWVQMDYQSDKVALHMIVREIVRDKLNPTTENCHKLLNGAYRWAHNAWNKKYEDNVKHSPIIYAILEYFRNPPVEWLDCFEDLATFAWIQGRFDLSESCELHLYNLGVEHYGDVHKITGERALRVAAVYHNQGDYAKARPWYKKGLEIQETIDKESAQAILAREKVARSDAQLGDYKSAMELFKYNYDIITRQHSENLEKGLSGEEMRKSYIRYTFANNNMAHMYACVDRHEEALPYVNRAYEYIVTDTVEPSLVVYILMIYAQVYYGLKEYEKAIKCIDEAIQKNIFYHGDITMDYVRQMEIKGDLYAVSEKYAEANEAYSTAIAVREKYFPSNTKAIDELNSKLERVDNKDTASITLTYVWN